MMHKFDYWSPTEVVFGKGREGETAAYVKKYGGSKVFWYTAAAAWNAAACSSV